MTPQEKELIQSVFERLTRSGVGQKDSEAEALIRESMQRMPDAAYGLVQAVIVQEMGLNQATQKIADLQRQLDEARAHGGTPSSGGSFLGGAGPWGGGSVPPSGQSQSQSYAPPPSGYGRAPQGPSYAPPPYAPPSYAPPPQQQASPWGQPSAAGGFLRNAASMAAGVAGGTLIAEGLSSLFGGHHLGGGYGGFGGGGFAGGSPWGNPGGNVENVTVNNYYGDDRQPADDDRYAQDDGVQDASYDDGSYDNGDAGFDGGFDDSQDV